ncbi:lipoprotein [Gallibacterium genomosp. 3]|uniref:Lipoprotein n=1 Tax=Gallibacterium genomosp. 3 TaxID=505345 RepID=A0A1A7PRA1_9PAST|nr:YcfL family protein [Gallibacterium genomosp. 3]OBX05103.1 lipoprotein [Gallibacterium genomosp. 3]
MRKLIYLCCMLLGLSACSSKTISPLYSATPIVNIESELVPTLEVTASANQLLLKNASNQSIQTVYLLTWYDKKGVTQRADWQQQEVWQKLILAAKQQAKITLQKTTAESTNYRVYFKAN